MDITGTASAAKTASIQLAAAKSDIKNKALAAIADDLKDRTEDIIAANEKDLAAAEKQNLASPLLKRLKFDAEKIKGLCQGLQSLIKLPDPVGLEGLLIYKWHLAGKGHLVADYTGPNPKKFTHKPIIDPAN